MPTTERPSHEAAILTRLMGMDEPLLSAAAARGILRRDFSTEDKNRMHELAVKARAGKLTSEEQTEIEAYSRISSLLGILKSKARRVLKDRGRNSKEKMQ